jgi:hypothetical protein
MWSFVFFLGGGGKGRDSPPVGQGLLIHEVSRSPSDFTATLQMLHFIYFSTTVSTEYFKHAAQSPFFSSKCRLFHNATFFSSCIIPILHTECAKI